MAAREIISLLDEYVAKVVKLIEPETIWLYGSQARGEATKASDIDIAVVVKSNNSLFRSMSTLEVESELYRLCEDVDWRIEPVLLESDDDPSGFLEHIQSYGVTLYQAVK